MRTRFILCLVYVVICITLLIANVAVNKSGSVASSIIKQEIVVDKGAVIEKISSVQQYVCLDVDGSKSNDINEVLFQSGLPVVNDLFTRESSIILQYKAKLGVDSDDIKIEVIKDTVYVELPEIKVIALEVTKIEIKNKSGAFVKDFDDSTKLTVIENMKEKIKLEVVKPDVVAKANKDLKSMISHSLEKIPGITEIVYY